MIGGGGRRRVPASTGGSGAGGGEGSRTPGKATATQRLAAREPTASVSDEAPVQRRAADPTSLERPAAESIEESRATLTLDADLLDERQRRHAARRNPRLQRRLGFDPSTFSSEPLDSDEFALEVARLQRREGLRVDGVCGPRTCEVAGVPVRRRASKRSEKAQGPSAAPRTRRTPGPGASADSSRRARPRCRAPGRGRPAGASGTTARRPATRPS